MSPRVRRGRSTHFRCWARCVERAQEASAAVYSNRMTLRPLARGSALEVVINKYPLSDIGLNYTGYGTDMRVHSFAGRL
ncbi:MAG: hypothetical protein P8Y71_25225 [Pseudolabrys sp.]